MYRYSYTAKVHTVHLHLCDLPSTSTSVYTSTCRHHTRYQLCFWRGAQPEA